MSNATQTANDPKNPSANPFAPGTADWNAWNGRNLPTNPNAVGTNEWNAWNAAHGLTGPAPQHYTPAGEPFRGGPQPSGNIEQNYAAMHPEYRENRPNPYAPGTPEFNNWAVDSNNPNRGGFPNQYTGSGPVTVGQTVSVRCLVTAMDGDRATFRPIAVKGNGVGSPETFTAHVGAATAGDAYDATAMRYQSRDPNRPGDRNQPYPAGDQRFQGQGGDPNRPGYGSQHQYQQPYPAGDPRNTGSAQYQGQNPGQYQGQYPGVDSRNVPGPQHPGVQYPTGPYPAGDPRNADRANYPNTGDGRTQAQRDYAAAHPGQPIPAGV